MRFQAHSHVHCPAMTNSTILVDKGDEKRSWPGAMAGLPPPGWASLGNPSHLSATPFQGAPLSLGFLRQDYWSGLRLPSPGELPDPGIKLTSLALAGGFSITRFMEHIQ